MCPSPCQLEGCFTHEGPSLDTYLRTATYYYVPTTYYYALFAFFAHTECYVIGRFFSSRLHVICPISGLGNRQRFLARLEEACDGGPLDQNFVSQALHVLQLLGAKVADSRFH